MTKGTQAVWIFAFVPGNHILNGRRRLLNTDVSKLHLKKRCEFKERGN